MAIAFAIYFFFGQNAPMISADPEWLQFGLLGIIAAGLPAMAYMRSYARALDADIAAMRSGNGVPDPARRQELLRKLSIGGALCELPLALGVIYLLAGAQPRWFVGAAAVTLALRLSYRPFRAGSR